MPAKKDQDTLTMPELEAFHHHEVKGLSIPKTAEIIGVSEKTVDMMKKKRAWRDLAIAALAQQGHTIDDWAKKVIDMKDRKKAMNISGTQVDVEDNQAQIRYLDSVEKLFGLAAPQKHEFIAGASDEELDRDLNEAAEKLAVESVEVGEQRTSPDDTEEVKGTPVPV